MADDTRQVRYVGPSSKPVEILDAGVHIRREDAPEPPDDIDAPVVQEVGRELAERLVQQASFEPEGWKPSGDVPPVDGDIDAVLEWVDGDPQRAARAAEAEKRRSGGPRKTLLPQLIDIADTNDDEE